MRADAQRTMPMPSKLPRIAGLALAGLLILVPHEALAQRGYHGGYHGGGYRGGGYGYGYRGYGYRGYGYRGGYGRYGYPAYGYGYGYPAYAYPGYGYFYPPYPAYYGGYYGYGGAALATGVLIGAAIAANRHQDHYIQVPVPYQAPVIEQPAIAPPPADPMQTCPDGSVVPANSDCPRHYRGAGVPVPSGISKDDLRDD
jgi:hypothetical protein